MLSSSRTSNSSNHPDPERASAGASPEPASVSLLTNGAASFSADPLLLSRWLAHCESRGPRDLLLSWAMPNLPPAELLQHEDFAFHFSQSAGTEVGFGCAKELPALPAGTSAADVFRHCKTWASRLSSCFTGSERPEEVLPRIYGGVAFQPGSPRDQWWQAFGAARFVLPRFSYRLRPDGATASVYVAWEERAELEQWLTQARRFNASLAELRLPTTTTPGAASEISLEPQSDADWSNKVNDILAGIAGGAFSKVVAARHWDRQFDAPLSPAATLSALAPGNPAGLGSNTVFAFRAADSIFLGATPERLIWLQGQRIQSLALAGTFAQGSRQLKQELLVSPKERLEHTPVLHSLVAKLSPFCETLEYSTTPELQSHTHFLHLHTPLTGKLKSQVHVLELVEALHPTPAVGGVPTEAALHWLAQNEGFDRGWYAGPVGWFDASGNGEFVVALRCGVLQGNQARLFAGAGIVAGSEPLKELAETEWKLRALKDALRLEA